MALTNIIYLVLLKLYNGRNSVRLEICTRLLSYQNAALFSVHAGRSGYPDGDLIHPGGNKNKLFGFPQKPKRTLLTIIQQFTEQLNMCNKKSQTCLNGQAGRATAPMKHRLIPYCDQIVIASLLVIIIAVPLYFDVHLHSVFDLSKITVLYVLTFAMLAIWSIKTILITHRQTRHEQNSTLSESTANDQDTHQSTPHIQKSRKDCFSPQLLRLPLILPIIAFLFVSGLATAFSINPYLSLVGTYKRYGGFISTIVYISLFFVIIHFIDKKRLSALLNVIILTACFASMYGILQHFGLDLYKWSTDFGFGIRVSATFGHPAFFSAFLIMVIPLILIKIFSNPPEQDFRASSNFRCSTFLYMGILTLVIVAFYYTKTRASFLGLLISNIFFFSLIGKKNLLANKTKAIVTITIIIGISIFFNVSDRTSVIGRFVEEIQPVHLDSTSGEKTNTRQDKDLTEQNLLTQPAPIEAGPGLRQHHRLSDGQGSHWNVKLAHQIEGTTLTRFLQYLASLRIIHDYPVLGIGPDTLGMIYPQYIAKLYREMNEHRVFESQNRIHNDLLNITVSTGMLGLGVYIWLIFAYARMVWKGCKKAKEPEKVLIIGLCAGCLAYFIQNQFSFGHVPIITLFWFLIGMSVIASSVTYSIPDGARKSVAHNPNLTRYTIGRFGKYIFCGIIICLMALLITLCLFRYKADIYFEHGRRTLKRNEIKKAIQSYELAVKNNPLALNYCNVLSGIYLKMAEIGENKESKKTTVGMEDIFSREQTTIWFAKAIDGAEQVQKLYPNDYHSAFTLGRAYHILSKTSHAQLADESEEMSKKAFKNYKIATTLHPFKFEFHNKLARLHAEKGQYEDAIYELNEARIISPANQASYLNLAKVFINNRGQYEEAETVLLEFIKKNPDNEIVDIYRFLSFIYLKAAKWEEVLEQSIKITKLNPEDLEALKYATMANIKLERYDDARKLCNRILDLTEQANNTYNKYAKEMLELLSEK